MPYEGNGASVNTHDTGTAHRSSRGIWTIAPASSPSTTHQFAINPTEGGSLKRNKDIGYNIPIGPLSIVWDKGDSVTPVSIQGKILTQVEFEYFEGIAASDEDFILIDDLGRTFRIHISDWQPKRTRKVGYPYYHDYTLEYYVLDYS